MEKTPMTLKGKEALEKELKQKISVERPAASKAIEIAREHGDLSENAEYHAAKEHQGMLEARIRDIEAKLSTAQAIDILKLSGDKVVFGATVDIEDVDSGEEKTYSIVGEDEADAAKGLISYRSPIARGLIGKRVDDIAVVILPSGKKEYEIREVKFIEV